MLVHRIKVLRTAHAGPAGCTQRIQLVQLFKMITNAACTVQGTGIAEKVGSRVWAACMLVCTHLWCQHAAVLAHEACSETVSCSADAGSVGAVRFCGTQVGCEHECSGGTDVWNFVLELSHPTKPLRTTRSAAQRCYWPFTRLHKHV